MFVISKLGPDLRLVGHRGQDRARRPGARAGAATTVLGEGTVTSLKRFKDDVREVLPGLECGIGVEGIKGVAARTTSSRRSRTEEVARTL